MRKKFFYVFSYPGNAEDEYRHPTWTVFEVNGGFPHELFDLESQTDIRKGHRVLKAYTLLANLRVNPVRVALLSKMAEDIYEMRPVRTLIKAMKKLKIKRAIWYGNHLVPYRSRRDPESWLRANGLLGSNT